MFDNICPIHLLYRGVCHEETSHTFETLESTPLSEKKCNISVLISSYRFCETMDLLRSKLVKINLNFQVATPTNTLRGNIFNIYIIIFRIKTKNKKYFLLKFSCKYTERILLTNSERILQFHIHLTKKYFPLQLYYYKKKK